MVDDFAKWLDDVCASLDNLIGESSMAPGARVYLDMARSCLDQACWEIDSNHFPKTEDPMEKLQVFIRTEISTLEVAYMLRHIFPQNDRFRFGPGCVSLLETSYSLSLAVPTPDNTPDLPAVVSLRAQIYAMIKDLAVVYVGSLSGQVMHFMPHYAALKGKVQDAINNEILGGPPDAEVDALVAYAASFRASRVDVTPNMWFSRLRGLLRDLGAVDVVVSKPEEKPAAVDVCRVCRRAPTAVFGLCVDCGPAVFA